MGRSVNVRLAVSPMVAPPTANARDFEALYAQHFVFVWRCLRALGVPADALDDAAQDVFVVAHRRLSEFRGDSSVRTWLYAILRNVAANLRRSRSRRGHPHELPSELQAPGPSPLERAQDREAALFVGEFLARLSDKKRELFVLALLEEMSMPEVAHALAIPLNTAYTRLRSLRLELQRALARKGARP
jgi:RNA polymerase sigma-70 factor (ECF subfamily)